MPHYPQQHNHEHYLPLDGATVREIAATEADPDDPGSPGLRDAWNADQCAPARGFVAAIAITIVATAAVYVVVGIAHTLGLR